MDLHIFGAMQAREFQPEKPTYVIRIFSSYSHDFDRKPLVSPHYTAINGYTFDDVWPGMCPRGRIMITEDIAETVLRDFVNAKDSVDALLVHCTRGINRSPAVGIALNEIFGLGHDTDALKEKYPEATWYAYGMLKEVAGRLRL